MLKELSIEIIRKCPSKCLHCSSLSDTACNEILEYNKFVSIVDDAARLGAKLICLSGGEPFLHPDIATMIDYIHKIGMGCYLYTCGIVFDDNNNYAPISNDILSLIAGKVNKIIFNIEGSNADTYDKIMGTTGCFPLLQKSILTAIKIKS
jgi:MoaA/NifB/PqqE/SkfB family radical SAM enzyme